LEKLTGLTSLDLSSNQISDISFLEKLTGLTSLDLRSNQISDLSPLRPIIHQLQKLSAGNNPIQYIPKEIYEQYNCATDLRAYWQSLDDGQIALNQQLKVMFLGNGCVGKTTLLHWFLDGAFRDISLEEGRTHGIIIQPYPFPDSEVMAHFWDFGGQEVYHATHRLFLGRRTLYLLTWASETPEKSEGLRHPPQYWLDMIADVADKHERSRVLIIQNRFAGQPERSIFDDEQRAAYEAQGLDIETFSVDAKRGRGMKSLLAAIQEAAEELVTTYQEQLPQNWVDIRTAVAQRRASGEKTLPMDDFLSICQEAGEGAAARTILGYLHRAGEVFHYAGRFKDQIILDQQWALKAVYAVLKRERIERYAGKFRVSDLIGIWREDNPTLTAAEAETFLQFMLDNQTAFYAKKTERGDDPELIIPQLLPEEAPSIIYSLEDIPNRLQHRVAYRFLHRDIISRFIVRTAYLSEQQEYWRQGIHIRRGQAKAAVLVENDAEGLPLLSLVCYGQGKEELLQRIREELHEIRPLDKAQEYRLVDGAWQPFTAAPLEAREGAGGLAAPSPVPEAVDLMAFFQPRRVFVSYSKYDREEYLEPLLRYLSPLAAAAGCRPGTTTKSCPARNGTTPSSRRSNRQMSFSCSSAPTR
jgi:internalin A